MTGGNPLTDEELLLDSEAWEGDEDLSLVDIEGGIDDGGRRTFFPEIITRLAGLESPHGGGRTPTKNFIDVIGLYYFHSAPRDPISGTRAMRKPEARMFRSHFRASSG